MQDPPEENQSEATPSNSTTNDTSSVDKSASSTLPEDELKEQKEKVKISFLSFWNLLWDFLKDVLSLQDGIDKAGTMEGIKQDVEFRGHAAWILIFSTLIASIGLNINSIPIIVGAMLISPLMGPILGIGLGAGINDWALLIKSLKNLGIAMGISLIISTLYFVISPVKAASAELFDRTNATVLALVVALFGGAAGIIAGSRPLKSNVVPGVAIATALMPPLCTAGYGLATLQWNFFFPAMYLFFINSVFIAFPTYLYIKYMRFPVAEFLDPLREKRIKRYTTVFLLLIVAPSAFIFYQVLEKSIYERSASEIIGQIDQDLKGSGTSIINSNIYVIEPRQIRVALMGDYIPEKVISNWQGLLSQFDVDAELRIIQGTDFSTLLSNFEAQNENETKEYFVGLIDRKDNRILSLRDSIAFLHGQISIASKGDGLLGSINNEARSLFPKIERIGFAQVEEMSKDGNSALRPTVFVKWDIEVDSTQRVYSEEQLTRWLRAKLQSDQLSVTRWTSID